MLRTYSKGDLHGGNKRDNRGASPAAVGSERISQLGEHI